MKRYFTSLNVIFAIEVVIVALTSLGLIPREAVLILTGLVVFYMIFSLVEDSLCLTIMSIPLFVALPIADNFDSMANWRILIAILFLCLFFKQGISLALVKDEKGRWRLKEKFRCFLVEYLIVPFLVIAAMSIFVADYKVLALKKLLFLINIFLLFLIIRNVARNKEAILRILKAGAIGAAFVAAIGALQFIVTLFVPLYSFWQFWAGKIISVFYGQNLAHLLSYSNTWFSYSDSRPPILRIFSIFPDSHSFAIFSILSLPVLLALAVFYSTKKINKIFFGVLIVASLAGAVLSGSRGIWLSFIPVLAVAFYLWVKKDDKIFIKKTAVSLLFFVLLFLASSFYAPLYYKMQSIAGNLDTTTLSFFDRAKSISDFSEISNKTRLQIWRAGAISLLHRPVLGVGFGNYITILGEDVSAAKQGASAHNLYLDIAAEIGIFGALLLFAIFMEILRTSWLVFRQAEEPYFKIFGLAFGLYFLWAMIYSLFDVVLLNDKVLLFFMVGVGTLYSIRAFSEKNA